MLVNKTEQLEEIQEESNSSEEFDVTRKFRQDALSLVKEILDRTVQGSKITQKDIHKAIGALHSFGQLVDQTLANIIHDMFGIVKAVAQSEASIFATQTNLKALVRTLEQKNIISREEMEKTFDQVLNEQIREMKSQMNPAKEESE